MCVMYHTLCALLRTPIKYIKEFSSNVAITVLTVTVLLVTIVISHSDLLQEWSCGYSEVPSD